MPVAAKWGPFNNYCFADYSARGVYMQDVKFSVLMSVYAREKSQYLRECLASMVDQICPPTEIVVVEDGPISKELSDEIDVFREKLNIISVKLDANVGLSAALNEGLKHCRYELVARMDTDDVSLPARFLRQIDYMQRFPQVAVSSAWIEERNQDMTLVRSIRRLPEHHSDIVSFAKRRSPISHPAVMFRKSAVLAVGGYPSVFPEDYGLWSVMIVRGYEFANIQEVLLLMRTGEDFITRRGINFLKGELKLLAFQRKIGFLTNSDYVMNYIIRCAVRLPPDSVKKALYKLAR